MTNQRWDRVAAVFDAAVLKEPVDRLAFVRQSCADDPETRDEVEALLAGLDRPVVIDQPITDAVAELLGDSGRSLAGTRFGPFQVESRLGAGGMGEVYRATDTVLGRGVAIKLLPQDFATDAERLARLRREARMRTSRPSTDWRRSTAPAVRHWRSSWNSSRGRRSPSRSPADRCRRTRR
jgi:serine/threonine protein kinase